MIVWDPATRKVWRDGGPMVDTNANTAEEAIADLERFENEQPYDNEADGLKRCTDCGGSGWVTLFTGRQHCPTCDGSGWT